MNGWDHRQYGTKADPIRQSDLNDVASSYGCSKRFQFRKQAEHDDAMAPPARTAANAKMCIGTAVHEAIRVYLDNADAQDRVMAGQLPSEDATRAVVLRELAAAADGLPLEWYGKSDAEEIAAAVCMVRGALRELPKRAASIVACEAPFLYPIDCFGKEYWVTGTADLIYRPLDNPAGLGLADWKTGAQRPDQIILDHGYQTGMYADACENGWFWPDDEDRKMRIGQFPTQIHLVHLRDHVPYKKAGSKTITRREDAEFYGVEESAKVKFVKGDERGPAWFRANRTAEDVARLKHSLRKLVGIIRMGGFVETIGDGCPKCVFRKTCLTDGHAVHGEEKRALEQSLRGIDIGDLEIDAA